MANIFGQVKVGGSFANVFIDNGVLIKVLSSNAGPITIGYTGVSAAIDGTGNGYILMPGEYVSLNTLQLQQLSALAVNGANASDVATYWGY